MSADYSKAWVIKKVMTTSFRNTLQELTGKPAGLWKMAKGSRLRSDKVPDPPQFPHLGIQQGCLLVKLNTKQRSSVTCSSPSPYPQISQAYPALTTPPPPMKVLPRPAWKRSARQSLNLYLTKPQVPTVSHTHHILQILYVRSDRATWVTCGPCAHPLTDSRSCDLLVL